MSMRKRRSVRPASELHREIDRICADLFDASYSYMASEELANFRKSKVPANRARLGQELYVLHQFFVMMKEVCDAGGEVVREKLKCMHDGAVAKFSDAPAIRLTVPRSRLEALRRCLLRSLFNSLSHRDDASCASAELGNLWFSADDDCDPTPEKG